MEKNGEAFKEKNIVPTVKHGRRSIMIWVCFSYVGTGDIVIRDGIMDSQKFKEILSQTMIPSVTGSLINNIFFNRTTTNAQLLINNQFS